MTATVESDLIRLGGVATWTQLRRLMSWRRIRRAVDSGTLVRTARGRYAVPSADAGRVAAARLSVVASHTSAALMWGWAVKTVPEAPHVTVPSKRRLAPARRHGVRVHWRDLSTEDVVDESLTSPVRTVIDCCLDLPFDEALAVFDSSWRGGLKPREVQLAALRLPRRQRDKVLRVARAADARAANPFESVLRAIAMDVPGLQVEPQFHIKDDRFFARVDLADEGLQVVLEAEGYEFHGGRREFERDCRRYNGLIARGWLVLRFTWEDVMFDPDGVRETLMAVVALRQAERASPRRGRTTGAKVQAAAQGA